MLVRALPEVERRIAPLYASLQRATMALWSHCSEQELALLVDVLASSSPVSCEETTCLWGQTAPPARDSPPAPAER